mmetsp:Transcript_13152/g.25480  ORF Transcript_13152/g.25480 Transcript_13152/m.25480 type:complete len:143 (+) Transcript_13152:413-841(+)
MEASSVATTPASEAPARGKCSGEKLEEAEVAAGMTTLCPSWQLAGEGTLIKRAFVAKNFVKAVEWINAVAVEAEKINHHPDLHLTNYREVEIMLQTHSRKGLTAVDFDLARNVDKIAIDYSPKFLRENPNITAGIKKQEEEQ